MNKKKNYKRKADDMIRETVPYRKLSHLKESLMDEIESHATCLRCAQRGGGRRRRGARGHGGRQSHLHPFQQKLERASLHGQAEQQLQRQPPTCHIGAAASTTCRRLLQKVGHLRQAVQPD